MTGITFSKDTFFDQEKQLTVLQKSFYADIGNTQGTVQSIQTVAVFRPGQGAQAPSFAPGPPSFVAMNDFLQM